MIEVVGVTKSYGDIAALKNISFSIEKDKIIGILGSNGAGKTTIMEILCGCIGADRGTIKVCGFDIVEEPLKAKSLIGYLPDEPPVHDDMTVLEFVSYVAKLRNVPSTEIVERVKQTLAKLSLCAIQDRLIGNLSKGYKQRVGLAQAIIHNPPILILDEPTEGLDPNQIIQIRELILSLKKNHTILFSSHILSEVGSLCDDLIIFDQGVILEMGESKKILHKFERSSLFEMKISPSSESISGKLLELDGVVSCELVESGVYNVELDSKSGCTDSILKFLIDEKYTLEFFSKKSVTLEEVFAKLTCHEERV